MAAAAEVTLEFPGDRVPARLGQVGRVLGLFQGAHVVGHLGVLLGQLVHAALPGPRLLRQVTEWQRRVQHVLHAAEQGQRGLRAGWLGHVVRHAGPQRDGRDARLGAGVLQHPHDPGRALVLDRLDMQVGGQLRVRRGRRHRHRAGMRRIGQQRAEQHHRLRAKIVKRLHQLGGEPPPAHVGLDTVHEHDVPAHVVRGGHGQPGGGPDQPVGPALGHLHHRPGHLEVVVVLRVDSPDLGGLPGHAQVIHHPAGRFPGIVPPLEGGNDRGRDELPYTVKLDHSPPPSQPPPTRVPDYVPRHVGRVTWVAAAQARRARRPRIWVL